MVNHVCVGGGERGAVTGTFLVWFEKSRKGVMVHVMSNDLLCQHPKSKYLPRACSKTPRIWSLQCCLVGFEAFLVGGLHF